MDRFKKICIFLVILVIVIYIVDVFPMGKVVNIINTSSNEYALGTNSEIAEKFQSIQSSNADQSIKTNALLMLVDGSKALTNQRVSFYKLLIYFSVILSSLIAIIGIIVIKKSKDKKYIGISLLISAILSIILILIFSYGIYLSMNLNI